MPILFKKSPKTISIHAPAKGATIPYERLQTNIDDFNPRSREGSDKFCKLFLRDEGNFNPRSREGSDVIYCL